MRFLLVLLPLLLPAASIEVTLDPALAPKGTSGRLIVLMKQGKPQGDTIRTGFIPGETWMAAKEVEHFAPGSTVTVDGDDIAFPRPFSQAPAGEWHYMAILDVDHSYARNGAGPGDLVSAIATGPKLTLSRVNPPRPAPADTDTVKLVEFESKLLSNFFGRPVKMRAGVLLPADFAKPGAAYPAIYHVHGFGGDHTAAWRAKPATAFRAVHIFLDASCPGGHHVFADSANNGPWGAALTKEFIPYLEKRFRLLPRPYARFLTGHSSGGWSTLWLQVAYPRFFGGTWPTAPDSVDFESFTGIDVRPGSTQNAYLTKEGQPLYLVRLKGKDVVTLDRSAKIDLLVPARATSSSNAILCGSVMLMREAIEKSGYDWKQHGPDMASAMMKILQTTGVKVEDKASSQTFRRLDLMAALKLVMGR